MFYLGGVGLCAVLDARNGRRDACHGGLVARIDGLVGPLFGRLADVLNRDLRVVFDGRGSTRDHPRDGRQGVVDAVGVEQHEDCPVTPGQRLELVECRIARGSHLAFVAHGRGADVARIAVGQALLIVDLLSDAAVDIAFHPPE